MSTFLEDLMRLLKRIRCTMNASTSAMYARGCARIKTNPIANCVYSVRSTIVKGAERSFLSLKTLTLNYNFGPALGANSLLRKREIFILGRGCYNHSELRLEVQNNC